VSSVDRSAPDDASRYEFGEDERPLLPGALYIPAHPPGRRIGYAATGIAMGLLGTFGNSLVLNNLGSVAGETNLYAAEAVWLSAAYLGVGAASNLLMLKGRQQFGLELPLFGSLVLYALAGFLNLLFPSFAAALLARGLNGLATSTGTATGIYLLIEALPAAKRPLAPLIGISMIQIASPLARLLPVETLTTDGNWTLHLVVLALPMFQLLLLLLNRFPPTYRIDTLERLDLVTAALVAPAMILLAGVLALGRVYWWTDAPWLGWMLAGAIALFAVAATIEANRRRPLFDVAWLGYADIGIFILIVLVERVALSEQSSSVPGLLGLAGLDNDQYRPLFAMVALSMAAGLAVTLLTFSRTALPFLVIVAILAIGAGAMIDSGANALTRPQEMILSQSLIGFGTTMFVGPALLFFIAKILQRGKDSYITIIIVFSVIENLGSVIGSALLGSIQYVVQQTARTEFLGRLITVDGPASERGGDASAILAGVSREAAVIGYLNSFRFVAMIAAAAAALALCGMLAAVIKARREGGQHD
jgi:hypothetical protein